jgi:hypothetical protein
VRARGRRRRRRRRRSAKWTVNEHFETTFDSLLRDLRGVLLRELLVIFNEFIRVDPRAAWRDNKSGDFVETFSFMWWNG